LLWKKPSISFRLLVNLRHSFRSQLWTVQRKREWPNIHVIEHRRSDKDIWERVHRQPGLNAGTVSRTSSVERL
jgi:hypothetical protein